MNKQTKEIVTKVVCGIGCGILGYLIGKGIERIVLGSRQEEPVEIEESDDDVVDAGEETENATPVENTAEEKKAEAENTEENKEDK